MERGDITTFAIDRKNKEHGKQLGGNKFDNLKDKFLHRHKLQRLIHMHTHKENV